VKEGSYLSWHSSGGVREIIKQFSLDSKCYWPRFKPGTFCCTSAELNLLGDDAHGTPHEVI